MATRSLVSPLLLFSLFFSISVLPRSALETTTTLRSIDLGQPVVDVTPSPLPGSSSGHGSKEVLSCERVQVSGLSRLKLRSYASAIRVTVVPSVLIPERLHGRIHICFHRNASLGLCQCEKDEWSTIQKGMWRTVMSPYDSKFVDVKSMRDVSGPITVSMDEEPQLWRLACLAIGFLLLLLAPVVSSWVPFYYSSSMVIGILLVIIILLFQGMKLLPTGRKSALYLTLYGSMLGAGSFLLHQFSMMVNSILVNFGLTEEMHNLVAIFLLVGIVLAGAALGYWIVRKYVVSEDGSVDVGVAQFVKWAMRVVAATFIFQGTLDTLLALGTLIACSSICFLIMKCWQNAMDESYSLNWNYSPQWLGKGTSRYGRAEFLPRTPPKGSSGKLWNKPKKPAAWSDSLGRGYYSSPTAGEVRRRNQDYYSVLHRTPNRKKFSEQEWVESKSQWTKKAMTQLVSSPEFTEWIIDHADRIRVTSSDGSDDTVRSDSGSSDEATGKSGISFNWFSIW